MQMKTLLTPLMAGALLLSVAQVRAEDMTADQFAHKAAVAGNFEIMTSNLALRQSRNEDVKSFAQQMVDDHSRADADLKDTAAKARLAKPDGTLDADHQAMLDRLKTESGAAFDKDYVGIQADAHQEAVDLFGDYAKNGGNTQMKQFASRTLPTLQMHKEHIDSIKAGPGM
jgi:putative membrane protein